MPTTQDCVAVTTCADYSAICLSTAHASTIDLLQHALLVVR